MSAELARGEDGGALPDEAGVTGVRSPEYCADPANLIWREWDDGIVVFQRSSNKTHLLNVVSATALEVLCERPADAHALAAVVAVRLERPCDDDFIEQIDSLLDFFEHLGLARALDERAFIGPSVGRG